MATGSVGQYEDVKVPKEEDLVLNPVGYRILVQPLKTKEMTPGGIIVPEERRGAEQLASVVAFVLKVGPDAYSPTDKRFVGGPWCKEGDFILMAPYAGQSFVMQGERYTLINDDNVFGVVTNPGGVGRA